MSNNNPKPENQKKEKSLTQRPENEAFWDHRFKEGIVPWDAGTQKNVPSNNPLAGIQTAFTDFAAYWQSMTEKGRRILIPGCGSAYEAAYLSNLGWDVTALDFSAQAILAAKAVVGENWSGQLIQADFFTYTTNERFDLIYERAFLCALPRKLWSQYGQKMADLLKDDGLLFGFFYFSDDLIGPPFGSTRQGLTELLVHAFTCQEDKPVFDSVPMFAENERWLIWQKNSE